jgi:MOSC domain-containing protein YiiM
MVKRFLASRRTGFYFRVLQEGEVGAGDSLELVSRDNNNITVADITQLYIRDRDNPELLHRAAQLEAYLKVGPIIFGSSIVRVGDG